MAPLQPRLPRAGTLTLTATLLLLSVGPCQAFTCIQVSGGNWTNAAIWSNCGGGYPGQTGPGDSATITQPVILDTAPTLAGLVQSGGELSGAGPLTLTGTFVWTGGRLIGGATVVVDTGGTLQMDSTAHSLSLEGTLVNKGTATWAGNQSVNTGTGFPGTFDNRDTFTIATTAPWFCRLVNTGTVVKAAAGTSGLETLTNDGTVQIQAGTLALAGTTTHTGTFSLATGTQLTVTGTVTLGAGSALVAPNATVRVESSLTVAPGATYAGVGTTVVASGTLRVDAPASTIQLTLASGATIDHAGPLTVTGTFQWTGGRLFGDATLVLDTGGTLQMHSTAHSLSLEGTLVNKGTATWAGNQSVNTGTGFPGTFDNRGTFTIATTAPWFCRLVNTGTVVKAAAGASRLETLTNDGTVQIQAGTLALAGTTTHTGTFVTAAGTLLDFAGTTTLTGSITAAGNLAVSGGSFGATAGTVVFNGGILQTLAASGPTTFFNLTVGVGTTLLESVAADNVSVTGALTNLGVIRKIQPVAGGGAHTFGLTGVSISVTAQGALSSVQVDRIDATAPNAPSNFVPNLHWVITPTGSGYTVALTLPHPVRQFPAFQACRYLGPGTVWDCVSDIVGATTLTRTGITALSTWAVAEEKANATVSGTVTRLLGGAPVAGVTIDIVDLYASGPSGGQVTTSAAGTYSLVLPTGTKYQVTPTLAGHRFTPANRVITNLVADTTADFVAERLYAISGQVRDLNDTGVPNVTMTLGGTQSAAVTTDAEGFYSLTGLAEGGTYTVTPSLSTFAFEPADQTFANLSADQTAAFFVAQTGLFRRYFAEGATGFFDTRLALVNATGVETTATLHFQKRDGTVIDHTVPLAGIARATVDPKTLPGLEDAEFSTVIEASQPVITDRTMRWDATGYGSHAETSIAQPLTTWYLAEGATIEGFALFYLVQNANATPAAVTVTYLLPSPEPPLVKTYTVEANSRFNIWVNFEDAKLATAQVSAVVTSDLPVIVERAMYRDVGWQFFGAGHEGAGVPAPATEWLLAEGATGPYFDLFYLVANPSDTPAQLEVRYLMPGGVTDTRTYTAGAKSRFNIWVDLEGGALADTAVSAVIRSTNGVPIVVERAMWWPGAVANWYEGHDSAGVLQAGTKWALADGEVGGPFNTETYVLIANTADVAGTATVRLIFEDGTQAQRVVAIAPNSRTNVAVGLDFPEAAGKRFGVVVDAAEDSGLALIVERAMYNDAAGVQWAAGSNNVGTRLR